jgi:hypothetical protein
LGCGFGKKLLWAVTFRKVILRKLLWDGWKPIFRVYLVGLWL